MLSKLTIEVCNLMAKPFDVPVVIAVIVAEFMSAFRTSELFHFRSPLV